MVNKGGVSTERQEKGGWKGEWDCCSAEATKSDTSTLSSYGVTAEDNVKSS